MQSFDTPLIQRTYDLYREIHKASTNIPKQSRYTLWQRCENSCLDALQGLIMVSYLQQHERRDKLLTISSSVDMLRILLRLSADIHAIDKKRYITLQETTDEIGRMLGGWLRSIKNS